MTATAKPFRIGRTQAVRLPREFSFKEDRVRIRRVGRGVVIEPIFTDTIQWFAELDRPGLEAFMAEGRRQPSTPRDVRSRRRPRS
jgi:antitoxin VapB